MSLDRRSFLGLLGGSCAAAAVGRSSEAQACIWDEDTIAQEAAGAPEVIPTLVGGFARNPPKYYAMRLARVTALLDGEPDDLAAYDDAGVACERLGRSDEAIDWMARKRSALDRLGVPRHDPRSGSDNHWYRYHANLGTFHAHRWLKQPDRWDALDELQQGRDSIAAAIRENPDAHFGREVYQLRLLDWLLTRPQMGARLPTFFEYEPGSLRAVSSGDELHRRGLAGAIEGLCGLITLGAGWNSVDVTYALAILLGIDGRQSLLDLASLRCKEIIAAGGRSVVLGAPEGAALSRLLPSPIGQVPADGEFKLLRSMADDWSARREVYLLERLDRGEHPDTHPDFWAEWEGDPQRMSLAQLQLELPSRSSDSGCSVDGNDVGRLVGWGIGFSAVWLGIHGVRALTRKRC